MEDKRIECLKALHCLYIATDEDIAMSVNAHVKAYIAELEAEVADLREELADIKDAHRRVMDEKCPTDEIHCTCIPALRSVIESLREHQRVLVEALKQLEWSGYDDYTQGNNCPICKAGSPQRWKHKKKCFIGAALAAKEG